MKKRKGWLSIAVLVVGVLVGGYTGSPQMGAAASKVVDVVGTKAIEQAGE